MLTNQPEWLKKILAGETGLAPKDSYYTNGDGRVFSQEDTGGAYFDLANKKQYTPTYGPARYIGGMGENAEYAYDAPVSYRETVYLGGKAAPNQYNGSPYNEYDSVGNFLKTGKWSGLHGSDDYLPLAMMLAPIAMQAMGAGFGGAAGAGGGAGAGAVGAGTSAGLSSADLAALYGDVGYGAAGSAAGAGAGAGAGAVGLGTGAGLSSADLAALYGDVGYGAASAGEAATAATAGASSLLSRGLEGLGSKALGIGASLLGGLAGAQGKPGQESTSTRDIPEWLKPYVQKALGYSSGLLDKQMASGMPGYDQMQQTGLGLLQRPLLGNGFDRFFPGR